MQSFINGARSKERAAHTYVQPHLRHLHLHVISDDLTSPSLKNKKHYNSFRPDLGFFVPLGDVQQWITDAGDGGDLDARATVCP